jgi:hypothetical protein
MATGEEGNWTDEMDGFWYCCHVCVRVMATGLDP